MKKNDYPSSSDKKYGDYSGTQSNEDSYSLTKEQVAIALKNQAIMKGFTGQVLGGAYHDAIKLRNYDEKPFVNREMLNAVRTLDKNDNAKAINFILFNGHYLNDDDMYWLTAMFSYHTPKGLAVNTLDLSNNCIRLNPTKDMPFFSFNYPFQKPWNILRLDLNNNNIEDSGAKCIADGLAKGFFPITKFLNLGGNKITTSGFQYLKDTIKGINQEIVIITETKYDTGKAIFKDTDSKFYEMSIKSDEKNTVFEFADGITGISGVSAGDTCPAPVKDQISGCILGTIGGAIKGWSNCTSTKGKEKLICIAKDAYIGCSAGVVLAGTKPCVSSGKEYDHHFKDNDKNWGFSVDGGTEIKGSYIDNSCIGDSRCMGSAFDLTKDDLI